MHDNQIAVAARVPTSTPATVEQYARNALTASALGYGMDGFDLLILSFLLPAITFSGVALSAAEGTSLVTITLAGSVLGGIGFGLLSDRLGRARVLTWTIIIFALFTGLCSLAQDYWQLISCRAIAGLGLGGEFGIGMALIAEAWPASKRARASSYVALGWQFGTFAAAVVTPLLLPIIGWRGMFAVGIAPAIVAFWLRRSLPEPPIFVAKMHERPSRFALRLLVKDAATAKLSLGVALLCSIQCFGYYSVMVWLPSYLASHFGFALMKSAVWTATTIIGMTIGVFAFGHFADRWGRRPTFLGYMLGAAVMVAVYARLTDPVHLLIAGPIMGFFVNGMLGGYGALISELFPTVVRATAQNVLFNIGRAVGGIGPVVIAALTVDYSFAFATALLSVLYLLDIVVLWWLIPERCGAELT